MMTGNNGRGVAIMADPAVESFLFREARLMDEHRFEDWLSLWGNPAQYWIPCNDDDIDPARQVSIIFDDRVRLEQRVDRLKSGSVQALDPRPKMRRVISNIEIEQGQGNELIVQSNFILCVARAESQQLWAGRTIHVLQNASGGFKIARKKVLLINNDQEMPLLQFLI
jgi:3-phenylpropionate/cinnamic acid dioxygenase small subunit